MKLAPLVLALGLGFLPGCALNLSDDSDFEAQAITAPEAPCQTTAPTPDAFEGGDFALGIVTNTGEPMTVLSAWPSFDDDGRFSVTVQPRDLDTGELVGMTQVIKAGPIDAMGRFAIDEVLLDLPPEALGTDQGGKGALAAVEGGFCLRSTSVQGTFDGWSFGPEPAETGGYWFIAREVAP